MPHFNRTINDPLISSDVYKAYSYQNPTIREQEPEQTLDLSRLRFSLDDFQKLTKGTYNAGELRLTDSGKLDIVNNHKTWTIFNNKTIDAADSFAIRVAFAKALEAGGVDEKRMAGIRKQLGLGSDDSLRDMNAFMPLTRQEVREIIDANIDVLNQGREGNRRLKTYGELHAGYSKNALEDIRTTRNAINQASSDENGYSINCELEDVLRLVSSKPSFQGISEEDAEEFLEMADMLGTSLERLVDDETRHDWRRENGGEYKVTVVGGANGMAIALEDGKVVCETVSDGKRSRISLGLTPRQLRERLNASERQLNQVVIREVRMPGEPLTAEKTEKKKIDLPQAKIEEPGEDDDPEDDQIDLIDRNPKSGRTSVDESKNDIVIEKSEIEAVETDPAKRKFIAKSNLDTLVTAMVNHYKPRYHLDANQIRDILTQVADWEDQLAECSMEGSGTSMQDLNEDLKNFLQENYGTIQKLIDEAIAD